MLQHATQRCVTKLWVADNTTHVHARVCVGIACSGVNSNIVQNTAPTKTMMLPPTSASTPMVTSPPNAAPRLQCGMAHATAHSGACNLNRQQRLWLLHTMHLCAQEACRILLLARVCTHRMGRAARVACVEGRC